MLNTRSKKNHCCAFSGKKTYSTNTINSTNTVVPWLAASGPLSYNPTNPPQNGDYFFKYNWVLPGIFKPDVNLRHQRYFGTSNKSDTKQLLLFWQNSRTGKTNKICVCNVLAGSSPPKAPIAIYRILLPYEGEHYIFIQHGSYQLVPVAEQPFIEHGEILLYRGLQKAKSFQLLQFENNKTLSSEKLDISKCYAQTISQILSDSVLSFNAIHDRTKRTETCHLRDDTWVCNDIAEQNGLMIGRNSDAKRLWDWTHQSFSLVRWMAKNKFGPHYVIMKTPINNIRITTFFAGEYEAKIVDPTRVELLKNIGCAIEAVSW